MPLLIVLALGGLMHAAGSFITSSSSTAMTALAFGFLVLTAFFVGRFFKAVRLPKLTGYIATGIVAGPYVLKLVSEPVAQSLGIFSGVAVALISISGGLEMEFRSMRPLFRTIRWVTIVAVLGTTVLLALTAFLVRDLLPFMRSLETGQAIAIAFVLAVVMVAQSPAVVMAIRSELQADGPASKAALGVVIIADLVVILLFAVASSIGKSVLGGGADVGQTVKALAWEIFGSVGAGVLIGLVLAVYLSKIKEGGGLFVMAVCLVIAEVGRRLHLDSLLVSLTAGIAIRNFTKTGDKLHHAIEGSSLPVYIVFFAVAGATIHLSVLKDVWLPALIFVVVRGGGFLLGANLGTRIAGAPPAVRRYAGFGLLPQAGLALALSLLFAETFPEFGADASALTLGIVAINEIVAPALYRFAVVRSGEAGKAVPEAGQEPIDVELARHATHAPGGGTVAGAAGAATVAVGAAAVAVGAPLVPAIADPARSGAGQGQAGAPLAGPSATLAAAARRASAGPGGAPRFAGLGSEASPDSVLGPPSSVLSAPYPAHAAPDSAAARDSLHGGEDSMLGQIPAGWGVPDDPPKGPPRKS